MGLLAAALLIQVVLFRRATARESGGAAAGKFIAILSLTLWAGVGVAGRAIGFI